MHIKNKRGQSTVEYILLVTAVVAVMIVFATGKSGVFQTQLGCALNTAVGDITDKATALTDSHKGRFTNGAGLESLYTVNVSP